MVALQTVEIPGYREAIKRERNLRDLAFLGGMETLCGEVVEPLSLRRLIWLEHAHNGFVCPWRWESDAELLGHALALIYFVRPGFRPPNKATWSFWKAWGHAISQHRFSVRVLSAHKPDDIVAQVEQWLAEAFMDAPVPSGTNIAGQSYASYPAYIFDTFGAAGLTFSNDEILDMPLKRLWQHLRVASARLDDAKLANPSDEIAVKYIAQKQ